MTSAAHASALFSHQVDDEPVDYQPLTVTEAELSSPFSSPEGSSEE
jgi:hypothetical protein